MAGNSVLLQSGMRQSMRKWLHRTRKKGQALVEFALAATLIFFLLGAAVDIGLMFFTMQELRVAAQEGATFGSYPVAVVGGNNTVQSIDLRYGDIVKRVRESAGDSEAGFADLLDLNQDDIDDAQQDLFAGGNGTDPNGYIYVQNLFIEDNNPESAGAATRPCDTTTPKVEMRYAADRCFIQVTVRYDYKLLFPLLPAFADKVPLRVSYIMKVRSSFIG
jgi:hypothetical protein